MESKEEIVFKIPIKTSEENENELKDKESQNEELVEEKIEPKSEPKTVLPEPLTQLLPPNGHYFVDQLKNGTIIEHKLLSKSRITFGRARDCDVVLEHPSISRYHAILLWSPKDDNQYQNGENMESFWYLIDCGSTHGTQCNKTKIIAGKLIKLIPNNNVFKFGASTRLFSLGSILDDNEDEEEVDEENMAENIKEKNKKEENVDNGCSWGMNDEEVDAENEETGDSQSLQAIIAAMKSNANSEGLKTTNDNVYSANPNKCLQQWFEREGYDMEYKCDSIHNKFKCTFELPIDGQWIPVEGSLMHKKKEAISDACLKSCQLLDRAELLFPWQQQKARLLRRKQEEDMDSDNDMIDETVKISKKRTKRDSESNSDNTVDNYETLSQKWSQMNEELRQLRIRLAKIGAQNDSQQEVGQEFDDSLDNYMASIGKQKYGLSISDKIEKSNIKMKITQLEKEQQKVEKLIKLAKPTIEFQDVSASSSSTNVKQSDQTLSQSEIKSNSKQDLKSSEENVKNTVLNEKIDVKKDDKELKIEKQEVIDRNQIVLQKTEAIINEMKSEKRKNISENKTKSKLKAQSIVEAIEKEKKLENKAKQKPSYDNDFVDWLPPTDQSGDGKTHLNYKFGY